MNIMRIMLKNPILKRLTGTIQKFMTNSMNDRRKIEPQGRVLIRLLKRQ